MSSKVPGVMVWFHTGHFAARRKIVWVLFSNSHSPGNAGSCSVQVFLVWQISFFIHLLIQCSRIIWLSLGKINSWKTYRKKELFPRKSPLKFIANCSDLQSAEKELIGLEGFETAVVANSSPRKKWLCLLCERNVLYGKGFGLYPVGSPCAADGKTSEARVAEQ